MSHDITSIILDFLIDFLIEDSWTLISTYALGQIRATYVLCRITSMLIARSAWAKRTTCEASRLTHEVLSYVERGCFNQEVKPSNYQCVLLRLLRHTAILFPALPECWAGFQKKLVSSKFWKNIDQYFFENIFLKIFVWKYFCENIFFEIIFLKLFFWNYFFEKS